MLWVRVSMDYSPTLHVYYVDQKKNKQRHWLKLTARKSSGARID